MTRQNLLPSSEDARRQIPALIPLWDLCNHDVGKLSTDVCEESGAVLCYAMRPFAAGDEMTIFYGKRSDREFLIHNGFVPERNPHNYLLLNLGISKSDRLAGKRTALCAKAGVPVTGKFTLTHRNDPLDPLLLSFLRIFLMNQEQLDHWLGQDDVFALKSAESGHLKSLQPQVNDFLKTRASLLLHSYPSDDKIEGMENVFFRRLLTREKEILESHACA